MCEAGNKQDQQSEAPELLPRGWGVDLLGFSNKDEAEKVGNSLLSLMSALANAGFDLRSLDGVTVAFDYKKALRDVERGFTVTKRLEPTDSHNQAGAAMAVGILKDGTYRARIVLSAWIPWLLISENEDEVRRAVGLIAHEAAHVELGREFEERLPGVFARPVSLKNVFPSVEISAVRMWDEYSATRRSGYIVPEALTDYETNISTLAAEAEPYRIGKILDYRLHGNHGQIIQEITDFYHLVTNSLSYLMGHLDGTAEAELPSLPRTIAALEPMPQLNEYLPQIWTELRRLWDTKDEWSSMEVFRPLCALYTQTLSSIGLVLEPNDSEGWRANLPFTPETTPDTHYCAECGASYFQPIPLQPSPCHGALSCPIAYPFEDYRGL